ncbi:unnamed protein product [Lota lota]
MEETRRQLAHTVHAATKARMSAFAVGHQNFLLMNSSVLATPGWLVRIEVCAHKSNRARAALVRRSSSGALWFSAQCHFHHCLHAPRDRGCNQSSRNDGTRVLLNSERIKLPGQGVRFNVLRSRPKRDGEVKAGKEKRPPILM